MTDTDITTTSTTSDQTLVGMSPPTSPLDGPAGEPADLSAAEQDAVRELVRRARASGTIADRTGRSAQAADENGRRVRPETGLDEEMSEHLGYDKGDTAGRNRTNSRNGKRSKTVITDNAGPVTIEVPAGRIGAGRARSTRSSSRSEPAG